MTELISAPRRHLWYFRINEWLLKHLVTGWIFDELGTPHYFCPACIREDHAHCESANDRPSFCECCSGGYHGHPHDPSEIWPHPTGARAEQFRPESES